MRIFELYDGGAEAPQPVASGPLFQIEMAPKPPKLVAAEGEVTEKRTERGCIEAKIRAGYQRLRESKQQTVSEDVRILEREFAAADRRVADARGRLKAQRSSYQKTLRVSLKARQNEIATELLARLDHFDDALAELLQVANFERRNGITTIALVNTCPAIAEATRRVRDLVAVSVR